MALCSSDEVSLDINKVAQSMKTKKEMLKTLSENCCIYIVPPRPGMVNKEIYTPRVVSIGPFHHGKNELKAMEEHKLRYSCAFLDRIGISIEKYHEGLKELEIRLRESYEQINGYSREEFMEIMAVDGAFLMELLLKFSSGFWETNDRILRSQRWTENVKNDTLLLENQLPFFYLEYLFRLFEKSRGDGPNTPSLKIIVLNYLLHATPWRRSFDETAIEEETQVEHLLHFLIICVQGPERTQSWVSKGSNLVAPTIWELHQAGVKFKRSSSSDCLSNINFSNGILEIPLLVLEHVTEMALRNMQAFEECHHSTNYISDYISIMDILINKEEDVKVLVQNGIMENWLGDDRVDVTVFNNLGKGNSVYYNNFSYTHIIEELKDFCKIRRHRWKATLREEYFNSPWTIIFVVAATFLLLLTIIQTVCSVLEVI